MSALSEFVGNLTPLVLADNHWDNPGALSVHDERWCRDFDRVCADFRYRWQLAHEWRAVLKSDITIPASAILAACAESPYRSAAASRSLDGGSR